jgi:tetratricopeptide (TPR) repeat protein
LRVRRRALAIREKSLGPEHPETASALNDLAILLQNQGDLVAARPLLERALTICETTLGPSMRKLRRLNDLAIIQDQGDLEEAHLLYGRALAIREKALGRDHPVTAMSIMNLAILQQEQSDCNGARPLYERALEICEKGWGSDHPQANIVRYNWARFLLKTGQPTDAPAFGETALVAEARIFGPNQSQHRRLGPRHCLRRAWPHRGREGAAGAIWAQGSMK